MLKFKRDSEMALEASGLPFTILRPSRLTDGPYTSYDLNTLLQVRPPLARLPTHIACCCVLMRLQQSNPLHLFAAAICPGILTHACYA